MRITRNAARDGEVHAGPADRHRDRRHEPAHRPGLLRPHQLGRRRPASSGHRTARAGRAGSAASRRTSTSRRRARQQGASTRRSSGISRPHGKWQTDENNSLARRDEQGLAGAAAVREGLPHRVLRVAPVDSRRSRVARRRRAVGARAAARGARGPASRPAASLDISKYSGHWQGNGQPCAKAIIFCGDLYGWAGSVLGLRSAIKNYHEDLASRRRASEFEDLASSFATDPAPAGLPEPASEPRHAAQTRFVKLEVLRMRGFDWALGDPGPDDADIYANAKIRGQDFDSPVIHDHDRFSFPKPYGRSPGSARCRQAGGRARRCRRSPCGCETGNRRRGHRRRRLPARQLRAALRPGQAGL